MYARAATFEGDPAGVDDSIREVRTAVEASDTPPGLEEAKMLMLVNREPGGHIGASEPVLEVEEQEPAELEETSFVEHPFRLAAYRSGLAAG